LPQENEEVAQAFSDEFKQEFVAVPMHTLLVKPVGEIASQLCSPETGMYLRLWPHLHHTDGFFAAAWTKK
jgi:16S rRNA (cytosine967-C5)-methyltransferase